MRALAVVGPSNSGKTTFLTALTAHLVARGYRVGAIKHTHHTLNDRREGDTARLAASGCEPVILAGDGEAVVFEKGGSRLIRFEEAEDLLAIFDCDVVLIEGFKSVCGWPRIDLDGTRRVTIEDALTILNGAV